MFKLVQERAAWWPVIWDGVDEDGSVIERRVELKFRVVGRKMFMQLFDESKEVAVESVAAADMELAHAIVAEDWRGVGDETGKPLPFSWDSFAQLLDVPGFSPAMGLAYYKLYAAVPEEREKNSAASPVSGPVVAPADATPSRSAKNSSAGARRKKI